MNVWRNEWRSGWLTDWLAGMQSDWCADISNEMKMLSSLTRTWNRTRTRTWTQNLPGLSVSYWSKGLTQITRKCHCFSQNLLSTTLNHSSTHSPIIVASFCCSIIQNWQLSELSGLSSILLLLLLHLMLVLFCVLFPYPFSCLLPKYSPNVSRNGYPFHSNGIWTLIRLSFKLFLI